MQLLEYYHRLQTQLQTDGDEVPVTLELLADILYCSERNVKLLLKRMSELAWIRWVPGRGRGNRSLLSFLVLSDELLIDEAKRLAEDGSMKAALELMNLPGVRTACKQRYFEWLAGHFGYRETVEREKKLDTLRLPFYAPILTLDPADMLFAKDLHLVKQIFDTLVRFDPQARVVKPHLAHHWEANSEGTRWTFYLRKGVRFHHGRELTAQDAAYTLLRLKAKEQTATNGWLAASIKTAAASSRYTLVVELNGPNYMFLHYVSAAGLSVLPEDIYERTGADVALYPVGSGPFRVAAHDDCVCVLEAFVDYFQERAHLDRVELWIIPEECVLKGKQLHMEEVRGWEERPTHYACGANDWNKVQRLEEGCYMLTFNMAKQGPHQHRNFRLALHHLLDRGKMVEALGHERFLPAQGFLPPKEPLRYDPDYDGELALRLLNEMQYAGEPLHICLTDKHKEKGNWIKAQCARFGIPVLIHLLSMNELGRIDRLQEADCTVGGVVADEDLDLSIMEMVSIGNMPIGVYLRHELGLELSKRIDAIHREPSERERLVRLGELEQVLKRDGYVLFLLHHRMHTSYHPVVKGVTLNSSGFVNFKDLWFQSLS